MGDLLLVVNDRFVNVSVMKVDELLDYMNWQSNVKKLNLRM